MNRLISSRLAARAGVRQVAAVLKAERVANAADRAVGKIWRELLAVLRAEIPHSQSTIPKATDPLPQVNLIRLFHRVRQIADGLHGSLHDSIHGSLASTVRWGHKSTRSNLARTLPTDYLLAAAANVVESRHNSCRDRSLTEADNPGVIELFITQLFLTQPKLATDDRLRRLREPAGKKMTDEEKRALIAQVLFPPPSVEKVERIVSAPTGGVDWVTRLRAATRLAAPEKIAGMIVAGYSQGLGQREIAKNLLPLVNGVKSTARRIARTEGMRVASHIQQEMHDQLGDLVMGYQVHATLDAYTRPWHAHRNGTIYYLEPQEGQKGPRQMPHPPEEAEDPAERPAGTPHTAYN